MTSLAWVTAIWVFVYARTRSDEAAWGEDRLHVALALSLIATSSITSGSSEDIVQNPVVIERIARGLLSGTALVLATPVLIRRVETILERSLPTFTIFLGYAGIAGISTLYSVAPLVTAGKAFELGVGLLIVLGLLALENPAAVVRRTVRMLMFVYGVELVVALIGFFALPGLFTSPDGRPGFITARTLGSPYDSNNGLSYTGATFATFNFALFMRVRDPVRRRWLLLGTAVGVMAFLLASGRQGLVIFLLSIIVVVGLTSPSRLILWMVPVAAAVAIVGERLLESFMRGQPDFLLLSLSGRTNWWASAVTSWLEQPLTGFGYGAGGRFVALERIGAGGVSSVHSGYLEVLVGLGLLGFIPLMAVVLRTTRVMLRVQRTELHMAILIVPLILHASISIGFGGWWSSGMALLALLAGFSDVWSPQTARDSSAPGRMQRV